MIGLVLLDALSLLIAALAWWQFMRSLRSGKADIKGWVFERKAEPYHYWSNTIMFGVAGLMMTAFGTFLLVGLVNGDGTRP